MTHTITRRRDIAKLALLTALLTVAIGVLAIATLATTPAPASATDSGPALSGAGDWDRDDGASTAEIPTLTNNVAQPNGGAEPQLALGIGLLATALLGLVVGLAAHRMPRRAPSYDVQPRRSGGLTQRALISLAPIVRSATQTPAASPSPLCDPDRAAD